MSNDNNIPQKEIQSRIYMVRGQHVMLDSDIARFYNMETKRINEQVKRNPIKFPERYVFQLTAEEVELLKSQRATTINEDSLRSQNATLNEPFQCLGSQNATLNKSGRGRHAKYLPYAFTEQGASMLATSICRQGVPIMLSCLR